MTVLIDYDAGNTKSVEKAFSFLGEETLLTRDFKEIQRADRVVFPGVGSFGSAMENLKKYDLINPIKDAVSSGKSFMGICLGFQLLFSGSEEDGGVPGLDILKGDVKKFDSDSLHKVPQIGWNSLNIKKHEGLLENLKEDTFVYFVHSYYAKAVDRNVVAAETDYTLSFDSAIEAGSLMGCQFHPEKSSGEGLKILKNFLEA